MKLRLETVSRPRHQDRDYIPAEWHAVTREGEHRVFYGNGAKWSLISNQMAKTHSKIIYLVYACQCAISSQRRAEEDGDNNRLTWR